MNIAEQIDIMKFDARLANRAKGEGLRNWNAASRAASLAVRQAAGSVWGWNKRKRASPQLSTSPGFDASIDAMTEDAETIRRAIASQKAGIPVLGAPSAGSAELSAQRLEDFKAWLSEVQRTDNAIADFNEIVAVMGGLTSGIAKAQRGQTIGPDYASPTAESAARKASVIEKSIRRNYEKRNESYLRKNPDERGIMMDMVAEKAEYYSASPARKAEMEKAAYRQIRDYGSVTMREAPAAIIPPAELAASARERARNSPGFLALSKSVRRAMEKQGASYLKKSPEARDAFSEMVAEKAEYYAATPAERVEMDKAAYRQIRDSGLLYNRAHSAKCAASTSDKCECTCGGAQHGGGTGTKVTAVTDDGTHKSAGGTRADGTSFFASVGEDIGDGTIVVDVDVENEKVRVKDKDGNEYDISMKSGEAVEVEPDAPTTGEANGPSDEEARMAKIVAAFNHEIRDMTDPVAEAIDRYQEYGPMQISLAERNELLTAMEDMENKSPELKELTAELEAANKVFKEFVAEFTPEVEKKVITLKDCLAESREPGKRSEYNMKVDALNSIYREAASEAFTAKYGREPENQEEWDAVQKATNVPADFFTEFNSENAIENRHSSKCAASTGDVCDCSCGGAQHGTKTGEPRVPPSVVLTPDGEKKPEKKRAVFGEGKSMQDYKELGLAGMNTDWVGNATRRIEERERWGKTVTEEEKRLCREYDAQVEEENKDRPPVSRPYSLSANLKAAAAAREQAETEKVSSEGTGDFDKLVTGFKTLISQGSFITSRNLQNQLLKDHDQEKFKLAKEALAEAWHTNSLDRFQDKFGRDPNNNAEFRKFQKSIEVPAEYIGAGETK